MKEIKKIGKPVVNQEVKIENKEPQQQVENQLTRPLPSASPVTVTKQVEQKQELNQEQEKKKPFYSIARDEDQDNVYDATHRANNTGKKFNTGGGMVTYIVICAVSVLVSLLVGNCQFAPYGNYKKDVTRLEMDLVEVRNTIKADEVVENSTRTQLNTIGTNVGNINTQITGISGSVAGLDTKINNVNTTLAGQIAVLNNQVKDLQSAVNISANRSVNK